MIRDPSDGTVKEKPDVEHLGFGKRLGEIESRDKDLLSTSTSGLPLESQKPEAQAKLEKSRLWLKDYFHRRPEQGT